MSPLPMSPMRSRGHAFAAIKRESDPSSDRQLVDAISKDGKVRGDRRDRPSGECRFAVPGNSPRGIIRAAGR